MNYHSLNQSLVTFDEARHQYTTPEGQILSGVTSVLKDVIYYDKYTSVPPHVLAIAAERGTAIHNACQMTDLFDEDDTTEERLPEVESYLRIKREKGIRMIDNEYLVSDNIEVATMIDCIDTEGNLYDIKTTRELDEGYLSWQLSLCAHLFELQNPDLRAGRLFGIWLRGEESRLVEVPRKSPEEIEALLSDWRAGIRRGESPAPTETGEMLTVLNYEREIIALKEYINKLEEEKARALETLREAMQSEGVNKLESENLLVTLVEASTTRTFDTKRFKQDYPDLAEMYQKTSERKAHIKITLRKVRGAQPVA